MGKRADLRYERKFWKEGVHAVAGVDEAGVGPMAGPVVAAAVLFAPEVFIKGVHDSKQVPPEKREELYPLIMERAMTVGVGSAGIDEIDSLNIYWATMLAFKRALAALTHTPAHVLVDGRKIPGLEAAANQNRRRRSQKLLHRGCLDHRQGHARSPDAWSSIASTPAMVSPSTRATARRVICASSRSAAPRRFIAGHFRRSRSHRN